MTTESTTTASTQHGYGHHDHVHHGPHAGGILLGLGGALLFFGLLRAVFRRARFGGRRRFARYLFRRLDTSPSQEKVLRAAFHDIREALHPARETLRGLSAALGGAMQAETFDPRAVATAIDERTAGLAPTRDAIAAALARIHEVLTPEQRRELAALLERGPRRFGRFGHGPHVHGF